ncbi:GIY-YIG nuclease family protein [Pseudomonadales bacterium]|nr:GIY-YIG nuclease family protein [Pseudomonadales bacterium]MDA9298071.1 GIY-YIG nuclease family protein [Pseudomonadales bacterium]MDB9868696.1 GIY-YIG nuclease family protein [Pseudomonadales bacterium]MDB9880091.1 GIY-YIG nuclease family protein [Pseudomonadales bacterium]MDB9917827.1 GIY-YIG nuclease family protein [Pseudomonadales bacterium]
MKTRKELILEYKLASKTMGVYRIRNAVNNKSYIAASKDIRARFNRHRMSLKTRSERIKGLQADWIEHGETVFEFEIVDLLEPLDQPGYDPTEDLKTLLSLWLAKLQPFEPNGYN